MRGSLALGRWVSLGALGASALTLVGMAGCGGNSATNGGGPDGGSDATSDSMTNIDTGTGGDGEGTDGGGPGNEGGATNEAGSEGGMADSGSDGSTPEEDGGDAGGPVCGATPTKCVNPDTNANDFCTSATNTCSACVPVTDDPNCVTAYGAGYICVDGACVTGNCHTSQDCAGAAATAGQICGATQPNTCGACVTDLECQDDAYWATQFSPAGPMCAAGACVTAACAATGVGKACTGNAGDVCCLNGASGDVCVPGNCCTDIAACSTNVADRCVGAGAGGTCTACTATAGNTYYVDPSLATDSGSTGNDAPTTCAFHSITHALQYIGPKPPAGTIIQVLNTATVGQYETFPIVVPANVTIQGVSTAIPTVAVPAKGVGFRLDAANSALAYLTIDGQTQTADIGIEIVGGSVLATTKVSNVTVENMLDEGIFVGAAGAATTFGQATFTSVAVTGTGTAKNPGPGLHIDGGTVSISGTVAAPSAFTNNTSHGIEVLGAGSVTIAGTPLTTAAPGTFTVSVDDNQIAGLWISQTPGNAAPPLNSVTGLHVQGIKGGNGIRVDGGSQLTLRSSYILGNTAGSGVFIGPFPGKTPNNDVSGINLGTAASAGANILQGAAGGATNANAGVCLGTTTVTNGPLQAEGNVWGADTCGTGGTGGALSDTKGCAAAVDVGLNANPKTAITALTCTLN